MTHSLKNHREETSVPLILTFCLAQVLSQGWEGLETDPGKHLLTGNRGLSVVMAREGTLEEEGE